MAVNMQGTVFTLAGLKKVLANFKNLYHIQGQIEHVEPYFFLLLFFFIIIRYTNSHKLIQGCVKST